MSNQLDLGKLHSAEPKVKYGFAKELLALGAKDPRQLYDHFDTWDELISGKNNILKWTAIDIIGYCSAVDRENKIEPKLSGLIAWLHSGILITCNHAIFALGLIAQNKPEFKTMIIRELLSIGKDPFETEECRAIATGKVLEALMPMADNIKNNSDAIRFIREATGSQRNATAKKAFRLMKKLEKTSKAE